jgi:hypothetical protein
MENIKITKEIINTASEYNKLRGEQFKLFEEFRIVFDEQIKNGYCKLLDFGIKSRKPPEAKPIAKDTYDLVSCAEDKTRTHHVYTKINEGYFYYCYEEKV